MKAINAKLQKEINSLAKCEMITGELFIEIAIKANSYKELEEKQETILNGLITPKGLKLNDNLLYRKDLKIYISFKKA